MKTITKGKNIITNSRKIFKNGLFQRLHNYGIGHCESKRNWVILTIFDGIENYIFMNVDFFPCFQGDQRNNSHSLSGKNLDFMIGNFYFFQTEKTPANGRKLKANWKL